MLTPTRSDLFSAESMTLTRFSGNEHHLSVILSIATKKIQCLRVAVCIGMVEDTCRSPCGLESRKPSFSKREQGLGRFRRAPNFIDRPWRNWRGEALHRTEEVENHTPPPPPHPIPSGVHAGTANTDQQCGAEEVRVLSCLCVGTLPKTSIFFGDHKLLPSCA